MRDPLTILQKQELREASEWCLEAMRAKFPQHRIRSVEIRFDLRGTVAGQYRPNELLIRYNPQIAVKQFEAFRTRTVTHEVAHHVVAELWRKTRHRVRPHGREWQAVMLLLGLRESSRCHDYDLEGIQIKRQRRYRYVCACRTHAVSATRHNRIQRGVKYHCVSCRQSLQTSE